MEKENNTPQEPNEKKDPVTKPKEVEKINAIRDIIFGTDMAEYDSQFTDIRNMISAESHRLNDTRDELVSKINDLEENLRQSMKMLEEKLLAGIEKLDHEKTSRQQLGSLLEELGKKIKE